MCSKFHVHFRTTIKNRDEDFCFREKGVSICAKLCTLQWEYLLSAVNVLTNSLKISGQTKADFFQLNISRIHVKIG